MRSFWKNILNALFLVCFQMLLFAICRNIFLWYNQDVFEHLSLSDWIRLNLAGLRFDLSALAVFNTPFLISYLLPVPGFHRTPLGKVLSAGLYIGINSFLLLLNVVDTGYYPFTLRRSTFDLFSYIGSNLEIIELIPRYVSVDYWFLTLIWLSMIGITVWIYSKMIRAETSKAMSNLDLAKSISVLVLAGGLIVLAIRGGFQLKPIRPVRAAETLGVRFAPVVLNTPFTIMKSVGKKGLKEIHYFENDDLDQRYWPIRNYGAGSSFEPKNVVFILLESFSKEFMGPPFGIHGLTPFLDSLSNRGLFFDQAYANGTRSVDAIPAILAGIPTLMNDSYVKSEYARNEFHGLAHLLKDKGDTSAFFHGGTTGTMGFDIFCTLAGMERYYGSEDFPDQGQHDGSWGIYDEPFFQFFAEQLDDLDEPFFTVLFSLSSHHPYKVPKNLVKEFPDGEHPLFKTISYTDHALRKFFESAQRYSWYPNTLFVISADHVAETTMTATDSWLRHYAIPLLLFSPNDRKLTGVSSKTTQHIDIMPTVLDYLGYPGSFYSFGNSALDSVGMGFTINYSNNTYLFGKGNNSLAFNGSETIEFFNSGRSNGQVVSEALKSDLERQCRSFVQIYNYCLINNKQTLTNLNQKPSF